MNKAIFIAGIVLILLGFVLSPYGASAQSIYQGTTTHCNVTINASPSSGTGATAVTANAVAPSTSGCFSGTLQFKFDFYAQSSHCGNYCINKTSTTNAASATYTYQCGNEPSSQLHYIQVIVVSSSLVGSAITTFVCNPGGSGTTTSGTVSGGTTTVTNTITSTGPTTTETTTVTVSGTILGSGQVNQNGIGWFALLILIGAALAVYGFAKKEGRRG